jgi:hypothetical protein
MVADSVGIAVVLTTLTREHLTTCAARGLTDVAGLAGTRVRIGSRVGACIRSFSQPTRISHTVVDVIAGLAIAVEAVRARVTGEGICLIPEHDASDSRNDGR